MVDIVRRSKRALLFDKNDRLVLLQRSKPDESPFWKTAGGGTEPGDADDHATIRRELQEEMGVVDVTIGKFVFYCTRPCDGGVKVDDYHLARLGSLRFDQRTDNTIFDAVARIPLAQIPAIDLRPVQLRDYITSNWIALLADAPTR